MRAHCATACLCKQCDQSIFKIILFFSGKNLGKICEKGQNCVKKLKNLVIVISISRNGLLKSCARYERINTALKVSISSVE